LAPNRAFPRQDEFSLESATKARHRRQPAAARRIAARECRSASPCRAKPIKRIDAITALFLFTLGARHHERRHVDSSDPRGRDGDSARARAPARQRAIFPLLRSRAPPESAPVESKLRAPPAGPSPRQSNQSAVRCHHAKLRAPHWLPIVRSRGGMSFHSNPPRKLAIGGNQRRRGVSRHASLSAGPCRAKAVKRIDAITAFSLHLGRTPSRATRCRLLRPTWAPRGRDDDSARARAPAR
jgi:hypothetical protein